VSLSNPIDSETAIGAGGDGRLADRLRAALPAKGLTQQKMFGGIGFMLDGNMIAGVSKRGLLLRIGKDAHAHVLRRPGIRPMEMRGRPVEGYVYVDPGVLDDTALQDWVQLALAFVPTLPQKPAKTGPRQTKG
jgi:TfoX/Sxy family transcriptional regulator of competence genes